VLSLERAAVNARIREADRERAQQNVDLEREIRGSYAGRHPNGAVIRGRMDHIIVLDPEPLFPRCARRGCSRRTDWPPMPEEQRARMWCAAPNDCWLNPIP
jgi:hypothetical protein